MVRRNRLQLRISLILILVAAFFGAWYGLSHWQLQPDALQFTAPSENSSWIDVFSNIGEAAIQLFMGLTSGQ